MKIVACVAGLVSISLGASIEVYIAWAHPEMTERQLWITYPTPLAGGVLALIAGFLLVKWGSDKRP